MRLARVGVLLATVLLTPAALANGRFPNATQLVAAPGDPNRFAIRATYGLLQTFDRGNGWSWVCEDALGYRGAFDPAIVLTDDGTLLAGLPDGASATRDRGCSWTRVLGPSLVIDLARAAATPDRVVALSVGGEAGAETVLHASSDAGRSWSPVATLLGLRGETVDVAPSDPSRVYISGNKDGRGAFFRSSDGGATFVEHSFDLQGGSAPFIAAVHPRDANTVYLRVNGGLVDGATANDALFMTRDGGATFVSVPNPVRQLLGFALSPDGAQVAIGGPDDGVLVASATDHAFVRRGGLRVRCLTWTPDALFACSSRDADGFAVGKSVDEGATFTKFFDVPDLVHLSCPASSKLEATCREAWQAVSSMIGEDPNAFVPDAARPAPTSTASPSPQTSACGRCAYGRVGTPWPFVAFAAFAAYRRRKRLSDPTKLSRDLRVRARFRRRVARSSQMSCDVLTDARSPLCDDGHHGTAGPRRLWRRR